MLNKPIRLDELSKLLSGNEMVLAAALLAGARPAGGVRDAEAVALGVLGEEALEESGLAGAGRAGDDDGAVFCKEKERWLVVGLFGWAVLMEGFEGHLFVYR